MFWVWVKTLTFAGMLFIYLKVKSKKMCQITLLYTSDYSSRVTIVEILILRRG